MGARGCGSVGKRKVKRRVKNCKRENGYSNIGGNESTDMEVSETRASRNKDKSLYKCSHCFLICTTVDGLMQHLLTHQKKQLKLPKSPGNIETEEPKTKGKSLPTCKVIITRCDNLISPYQPIGTVHTLSTNIQEGDVIAEKTLQRKTTSLIKKACSRRFSLKQTSDCGITTQAGQQPHRCQVCLKSFGRPYTLKIHMRTHTGERPHRCQLCSKSFARQRYLKIHILTHTGERPHRCQLCSKSFGQLGSLKRHIQTHTGERPHQCHLCLKSVANLGDLERHIRTHTVTILIYEYGG